MDRFVLVTGCRRAGSRQSPVVEMRLDMHLAECRKTGGRLVVMHGGAKGVDALADAWARRNSVQRIVVPAEWNKPGTYEVDRGAGPRRNELMVTMLSALVEVYNDGYSDCFVEAFPSKSSKGTWQCIKVAKEGIRFSQTSDLTVTML